MSGPPDLFIAQQFLDEILSEIEVLSQEPSSELAAYLWTISSIVLGSWTDPKYMSHEAFARIEKLKCAPLLQPYLNHAQYTVEDITALKVAHELVK